jgi:selenophosphate synthetase-related protein
MNMSVPRSTQDISIVVQRIKEYPGLLRKQPIEAVFEKLVAGTPYGSQLPNYGDDAAVIPWGDGFLLLAADGIMPQLLMQEPYAAGKASIMVTVNDIYSMGGRPIALVNVLSHGEEVGRSLVVEGIRHGCEKLRVPMVGGHLHPDPSIAVPSLAVAILGYARRVLRSHLARPGDNLVLAVDLEGRRGCQSVVSWDANSGKTTEELLFRLETLPLIAERGLACAAKDISNAGILGTLSIMMENSGKGAVVDLAAIPAPPAIEWLDWLVCFQSFSFILAVAPAGTGEVLSLFRERNLTAAIVGKVTQEPRVILDDGRETRPLFDWEREKITGIRFAE